MTTETIENNVVPRILRLRDVLQQTGMARSTLYQAMKRGEFPAAISVYGASTGWVQSEVSDWVNARIAASRATQQREAA